MDSYLGAPGEASGTPTFPTRVSGEPQLMCRRQARVTAQHPHPAALACPETSTTSRPNSRTSRRVFYCGDNDWHDE